MAGMQWIIHDSHKILKQYYTRPTMIKNMISEFFFHPIVSVILQRCYKFNCKADCSWSARVFLYHFLYNWVPVLWFCGKNFLSVVHLASLFKLHAFFYLGFHVIHERRECTGHLIIDSGIFCLVDALHLHCFLSPITGCSNLS